jgi:YidC/Oxa1 family membrane protein insertase
LPIFIGLYRSLMIDVELRGAPLFSEAIRWCSNLSAPDMLFYWGNWWPQALFGETGWLGPYFNVLPLFTVVLFLAQQKMFMPPPTDEQSAMQQKVMTYMMVFMGVMFYKVASGLCLYFIASSLWGIGERKLLPKMIAKPPGAPTTQVATRTATVTAPATGNGSAKAAAARKKHRGRK